MISQPLQYSFRTARCDVLRVLFKRASSGFIFIKIFSFPSIAIYGGKSCWYTPSSYGFKPESVLSFPLSTLGFLTPERIFYKMERFKAVFVTRYKKYFQKFRTTLPRRIPSPLLMLFSWTSYFHQTKNNLAQNLYSKSQNRINVIHHNSYSFYWFNPCVVIPVVNPTFLLATTFLDVRNRSAL